MSASFSAAYYDEYWTERDRARTAARSRRRADLVLALLGPRRGSLLEVGCGPGWALEQFAQGGFEVVGVDVSRRAVQDTRQRGLAAHTADVDADDFPESLGRFDVVVALEVLEHLVDPLVALERIRAVVQPGGSLIVSLPNEWILPRRLGALVGRPGFGGHDDPHLRHFSVRSGRRFLEAAGLRVVASRFDGLVPPRWRVIKSVTEPLASICPGLFAISAVYLLEPEGTT